MRNEHELFLCIGFKRSTNIAICSAPRRLLTGCSAFLSTLSSSFIVTGLAERLRRTGSCGMSMICCWCCVLSVTVGAPVAQNFQQKVVLRLLMCKQRVFQHPIVSTGTGNDSNFFGFPRTMSWSSVGTYRSRATSIAHTTMRCGPLRPYIGCVSQTWTWFCGRTRYNDNHLCASRCLHSP